MYLIEPTGRKRKYDIRLRNHDGRVVRISGDRKPAVATRIGERVERLVKAKQNGDPPPGDLASWIANMDDGLADRLVELGLILARHRARNTRLIEWIEPWEKVVAGRKPDSKNHAPQQGRKVRRIITATKATTLVELEPDFVTETINSFETEGCKKPTPLATSTRRSYGIAIKDFSCWYARKMKIDNPLVDLPVPGQYENPEYERQPLTVPQFQMLTAYLDTFERYRNQKSRWNACDRKLVYWTAVKTGYREMEMKKLRRWNLYLDETPAVICLKARDTKNRTKGEVPIPRDLAVALKKYVADHEPDDRVFPFPETSGSIVDMLRRDLEGAGIPWKLPSGEIVDFHTLRATCITWWLDVDGLRPKRVQVLARLKGLAMVQNYSRNLRIEDFEWLDNGPKLVSPRKRKKSA